MQRTHTSCVLSRSALFSSVIFVCFSTSDARTHAGGFPKGFHGLHTCFAIQKAVTYIVLIIILVIESVNFMMISETAL